MTLRTNGNSTPESSRPKTLRTTGNSTPELSRPKTRVRIQGACDVCKKRKSDSGQMPGNRCTHCINMGLDCTHVDLMKTLSSAKGYVAALESRVEKLERLLSKESGHLDILLPGIDFTEHLENDEVEPLLHHLVETLPRNDEAQLTGAMKKLTLNPEKNRFFGKSSGVQLVQTALNFKRHVSGLPNTPPTLANRRKQFWEPVPWLLPPPNDSPRYTFPDPDLLLTLVDLYFKEINCYWPVLHRGIFEGKVADNLHLRDHRFGATLLMVCSLGSRYTDDPRILVDGETNLHAAGNKWHSQVSVIPKHLIYKPDLYELQTVALSAIYLMSLSPIALCWSQIGFGLRRAQDVGAHRRNTQPQSITQNEQWKRVFMVLLCLERQYGTLTGRPIAMHEQDFDQDLPIECDDEYWDLPEPLNFKQPKNKPSDISYFIHYAKLLEIQASVATTIYSPRKPKDLHGRPSPPTDAQNIMAFDSALNSWLLEVPDHLRWDPKRKNRLHFKQSAALYTAYYNVQILVHRPFIPVPLEASLPGELPSYLRCAHANHRFCIGAHPSLAICTSAARSCARIIDTQQQAGIPLNPSLLHPVFTAAIVLLLNVWSVKRSGFTHKSSKELDHVYQCLAVMQAAEKRSLSAGRFNDFLIRLIHAGENLDLLFDLKPVSVAPPLAQSSYEASALQQNFKSDASTFKHHVGDSEAGFDSLCNASHSDVPYNGYSGNGFLGVEAPYTYLNEGCDLEQLMNPDPHQFSTDMLVDAEVMSMWSTAPSGLHVDDWSYLMTDMTGPQFDQFPALAGPSESHLNHPQISERAPSDTTFWE
ncbi:putative fungal-specific transcription factor [Mycena latifolia]|nr:putative fungal-specific transcription factor [Mycena latifolia]